MNENTVRERSKSETVKLSLLQEKLKVSPKKVRRSFKETGYPSHRKSPADEG